MRLGHCLGKHPSALQTRLLPLGVCALLLSAALAPQRALALQASATPPAAQPAHDAKNIAGDWQGTLQTPNASLRLVAQIAGVPKAWTAKLYSIDQRTPAIDTKVTLDGNNVKMSVELIGATFAGVVSPDGNTMTGTFTQGGPLPLSFVRTTKETAWEIPAPPPPPKLMAADADPSFDVATVKPNNSGASSMQGLYINGRNFTCTNCSLADLLSFAYQVQKKQIVGTPDWIDIDRYDISAVPDTEGTPNSDQLRLMIRKLIAERFHFTDHHEKRDMSAFVLTVAKDGSKLKATEATGPLPGLGFRPTPAGIAFIARNASLGDVSSIFQSLLLDRPVVNRTGLTGRYDILCTFTPDDSEFSGHSPPLPARTEGTEPAPPLTEALQAQLGLKLAAEKTAVDVIAIDHVEKPTAN